ncbi:MAG: hypothetical protein KJ799_13685 [Bacteroidetes bacterium]|nr:hypothetical protein [Bacteroidota bacterium]
MITIFQFEFLFKSEVKKYLIALIYLFTAQVPTVATHIMTGLNLFYALTILYGLVFILILQLINEGEKHSKNDVVAFYTAGLSTFVINSSPVAILLLGKYIATVNFTIEIANSYVFASLLIAPMYFAGNIIERVIYTL